MAALEENLDIHEISWRHFDEALKVVSCFRQWFSCMKGHGKENVRTQVSFTKRSAYCSGSLKES